eukprot:2252237-Rhodomonas_salina.1
MAAVLKPSGASLGSDEKAKADGASNNPNGTPTTFTRRHMQRHAAVASVELCLADWCWVGESYYTESGNSFGYLSYGDIVLRLRQLQ